MQVREIRKLDEIISSEVMEIAKNIDTEEILLMFSNGSYAVINSNYNGIIYNIKDKQPISRIPIDTNWRPINVGIRLYNYEVKYCRSTLFQDLDYITWFYTKWIIKY